MSTTHRIAAIGAVVAILSPLAGCPTQEISRTPLPPSVTLIQPDDSAGTPSFYFGEGIEFVARVSDSYDPYADLEVRWSTTYAEDGETVTDDLGGSTADAEGLATLLVSSLVSGSHTVIVEVTDSDGMTATDSVSVDVLPENVAPTVTIDQPVDESGFVEGASITFVATASDDHGADTLTVSWTSNLDGEFDTAPPSEAGVIIAVTDALMPGDHTVRVSVEDTSALTDSDEITIHVAPANLPPSDPIVQIVPPVPTSSDDLQCAASGSVDPDGDAVSYGFTWLRDGSLTGITTALVDGGETARGETWTCQVVATDGLLSSAMVEASVSIGNSPPGYQSVTLGPSPAYEMSTLTCAPTGWYDEDGDPEGAVFEFFVDGSSVQLGPLATLTGADFDKHESVQCVAYPDDGIEQGAAETSNTLTIANTPPGTPTISVQPGSPGVLDPLVCQVDVPGGDDDPADTVSHAFDWRVDGAPSGITGDTVAAGDTALGEAWTCRATPDDGEDTGTPAEATVYVLPEPGDLVITEMMVAPFVVDDSVGEWFEVLNTSAGDIALDGFRIADNAGQAHVIASGGTLVLPAGEYAVLGNNANELTNGEIPVDYQYTGVDLANDADAVILTFAGVELDRVEYDVAAGWPDRLGQSLMLEPGHEDYQDNDDPAFWCGSTTLIDFGLDFATPGADNDECACEDSDDDGDVYGDDASCLEPDCDDGDPSVHPHGTELCNDIDDDCDGWVDELPDYDLDGYDECDDCDNQDATIHPGAIDLCDGVDDDCDGQDGNDDVADVYEPNDVRTDAFDLHSNSPSFPNCPQSTSNVVDATMESYGDEDWYAFYQSDPWWCTDFEVYASFTAQPINATLYLELYQGATKVSGGAGTTVIQWEGDPLGDDSSTYYIRVVRQSGTPSPCEYYALEISSSG